MEDKCYALVDSGADFCVFPSRLIGKLSLKTDNMVRRSETESYGSDRGDVTNFWDVSMVIDDKISLTVPIGFSELQNQKEWGVLGRIGFFDQFLQVCFYDSYLSLKMLPR